MMLVFSLKNNPEPNRTNVSYLSTNNSTNLCINLSSGKIVLTSKNYTHPMDPKKTKMNLVIFLPTGSSEIFLGGGVIVENSSLFIFWADGTTTRLTQKEASNSYKCNFQGK